MTYKLVFMCFMYFGFCHLAMAAEPNVESVSMSSAVLKAEKAYQDTLAKAHKSALAKVERAKSAYAKSLEKEMKEQLREHGIGAANEVQVMITELEQADPLAGTFTEVVLEASPETKERIKIERAYARRMRGQVWDVTKDIQKLIDAGRRSFRPGDDLKGETGFEFGGKLDIEWSVGRQKFDRSFSWRQLIDFDAIAEEEGDK